MSSLVYKIVPRALWEEAQARGRFEGAPVDHADGYIHFSTAAQVRETAARHFAGQTDLLVVCVPTESLGDALKWEVSRGGALFPHLYAPLDLSDVAAVHELPLGEDGTHLFSQDIR
ncbi:DUF952 domain-containing protein [Aureimonas populi]|uniref:DUF952 domain-containing protein n=1 Tax=Aureimonas populi TaxID=1701758 RepID=A0ABW5CMW2_9HYPH|nr:DUF952 domain-containing protein [Aureimonas populi]